MYYAPCVRAHFHSPFTSETHSNSIYTQLYKYDSVRQIEILFASVLHANPRNPLLESLEIDAGLHRNRVL